MRQAGPVRTTRRPDAREAGQCRGTASQRLRRLGLGWALALGFALAGLAGCARTSVEQVEVKAVGMPKPQLIVVHDFSVSATDVALDRGLVARFREAVSLTPQEEQRLKIEQEVAGVLATHLVKELAELGIPTVRAGTAPLLTGPTLSVEGQIVSIDEGNATRRNLIGFGAGRSGVDVLTQLYYDETGNGGRLVESFEADAESSRKPGAAVTMGAGSAAGHVATSAAASTGLSAYSEMTSADVGAEGKRIGRELAKHLETLFTRQGWITPPSQ